MRISDWSSDVCSSDLERTRLASRHIEKTMLPTAPLATAIRKVRRGTRDQRHIVEPDRHTGVRERDTKLEILDHVCGRQRQDRKSVVEGRRVSVRVDIGGRRIIKKKKKKTTERK